MTYAFGVALAGLADSPLDWLEPIILSVVETPEGERNYDLLSGYVTGIAEDYPDIVEAIKQRVGAVARACTGAPPDLLAARCHRIRRRADHQCASREPVASLAVDAVDQRQGAGRSAGSSGCDLVRCDARS